LPPCLLKVPREFLCSFRFQSRRVLIDESDTLNFAAAMLVFSPGSFSNHCMALFNLSFTSPYTTRLVLVSSIKTEEVEARDYF